MVKQFTINLNKQEGFVQRAERKRKLQERITLSVMSALLLAVALLTYSNDNQMRSVVQMKQDRYEWIVSQIDSLQNAGQNVSREDVMALARLDRERVLWTKKFSVLSENFPKDMAVTELKFNRGKFVIQAISQINPGEKEFDKVKVLIDELKARPQFTENFKNVKFKSSQRVTRDGEELLAFTIVCELEKTGISRTRGRSRSTAKGKG